MRIDIKELKKTKVLNINYETIEFVKKGGFDIKEPVKVSLKAKIETNKLFLNYNASGEIILECDRCLENFFYHLNLNSAAEYELKEIGDEFDMENELLQALLLSLPFKKLCKNDCRGLCFICGKNLNVETCKCKSEVIASPFNKLKELMKNAKS